MSFISKILNKAMSSQGGDNGGGLNKGALMSGGNKGGSNQMMNMVLEDVGHGSQQPEQAQAVDYSQVAAQQMPNNQQQRALERQAWANYRQNQMVNLGMAPQQKQWQNFAGWQGGYYG